MKILFKTVTAILLLLTQFCEGGDRSVSQKHYDSIKQYVKFGQYNLARDEAKKWAAIPDPDLKLMSKACAFLSNQKLHKAAIILLKRLDWIMPHQCRRKNDTLKHMIEHDMETEVYKVLSYGSWLTSREDTRFKPSNKPIYHIGAGRLFNFYKNDKDKTNALFKKYDDELKARPGDIGLITEYAYWLAKHHQTKKALQVLDHIDLTRLDLDVLNSLGRLWGLDCDDFYLIRYSIEPLQRALKLAIAENKLRSFPSQNDVIGVTSPPNKEDLLLSLARRSVIIRRLEEAKSYYEAYLQLPPRKYCTARPHVLREYSDLLKRLGLPDSTKTNLEIKANNSGQAKDWADLAMYNQKNNHIPDAIAAWEKAITLVPADQHFYKFGHPREKYRRSLIRLLDDNGMYKEELVCLKDKFREKLCPFDRTGTIEEIVEVCLKLDKKNDALQFLNKQLNQSFALELVHLILKTEHKIEFPQESSLSRCNAKNLPSWDNLLKKIKALEEPEKSQSLEWFYYYYDMHAEYLNLVERLPLKEIDFYRMQRLCACHRSCKNIDMAVLWAKKILENIGKKGFPSLGEKGHISTLESLVDLAVEKGDFNASMDHVKELCLFVPERFYFVASIAKLAMNLGKQDQLITQLKALAQKYPNRWVIWKVLAEAYTVFGDEPNVKACIQKVNQLR